MHASDQNFVTSLIYIYIYIYIGKQESGNFMVSSKI